jgi:outer membrane protein assembly factor BamE
MGTPVMASTPPCKTGHGHRTLGATARPAWMPRTMLALALTGFVAGCASDPEVPPAAPQPGQQASAEDDSWWPSFSLFRVPKVHKIVVQQGNVITQQMVDRLKPGMTKAQAQYVLGRPVLDDLFDPNRWVYVYVYQVPDYPEVKQTLTLFFENDALVRFTGDFLPTPASADATAAAPAAAPATAPSGDAVPAATTPATSPPPPTDAAPIPPAGTPAPAGATTEPAEAATG